MGGSGGGGGGGGSHWSGGSLLDHIRASHEAADAEQYAATVDAYIGTLLTEYNSRDSDKIAGYLETIKKALEKEIDGPPLQLRFGGSVAKRTFIDGLSDVDALVFVNRTELENLSPAEIREYFRSRLAERLTTSKVTSGDLAVTVKLAAYEIQLLPAIRVGQNVKIPNEDGSGWITIRPKEFTERLSDANKRLDYRLVPTIKLAKGIIASFPKERRLSGYHVEALAIELFKDYDEAKTPRAMLQRFFAKAAERVLEPLTDPTGQSKAVDLKFKGPNSLERKLAADALTRVARRMATADAGLLVDAWKEILEG